MCEQSRPALLAFPMGRSLLFDISALRLSGQSWAPMYGITREHEDEQIISFISVDEEGGEGGSYVSFDLYNPLGCFFSLPLTSPLKVPLTPLLFFSSLLSNNVFSLFLFCFLLILLF